MRRPALPALALAAGLLALPAATHAQAARAHDAPPRTTARALPPSPGLQCRQAIFTAERAAAVPPHLMAAIARVESGRPDARGTVHPWPWTINAEGAGQYFPTKDAALAAVRTLQSRGVRSIDVGCMQVNLHHHPTAFASLEHAFDPAMNAAYAARYLTELYAATRDWTRATAFYHSATPDRGDRYQRRVAAVWPDEQKHGAPGLGMQQANAWSINAFTATAWNSRGAPGISPRATNRLSQSGQPVGALRLASTAPRY